MELTPSDEQATGHLFPDLSRLQRLVSICGPETGVQLLQQLGADFGAARDSLATAITAQDRETIRLQCHIVKGLAGTVGATGLQNAAATLGIAAINNHAVDPRLAGAIMSALTDLISLLVNDDFRRSLFRGTP